MLQRPSAKSMRRGCTAEMLDSGAGAALQPGSEASILPLRLTGVGLDIAGHRLLDGVSFELKPGPLTVILGANGAGKSLLLKICHGLLSPTRGEVNWQSAASAQIRSRQAMVFQRPVLLRRSVAANIAYVLRLQGVSKPERQQRIAASLQMTGLTHLQHRGARVLSGGEQQKLAVARAWAVRPEIVFLDEPTANIDPAATLFMESLIKRFSAAGTKVVLTSHDLGQASRLADEVLFLHQGQLLEQAPAQQFFARPENPHARAFLRGELPG